MTIKTLSQQQWHQLIGEILIHHHTSAANATTVADALIAAESDGQTGHGLSRIISYVNQLKSGKVDGQANPYVNARTSAGVRIDAANGFAYPALVLAVNEISKMAPKTGIAAASICRSHHFGQAGYHVEKLAKLGLIGLIFGNSPKAIAPWGGAKAVFGTNPIAFAAPRNNNEPLVIDLSLSKVARGKVMVAKQNEAPIPLGWALDEHGQPTTNAQTALAGTMLPMGDAKGAALVMMVEVLAAALSGAQFGFEASSFFDAEGSPPDVGQLLLAVDPNFFSNNAFAERLETLITTLLTEPNTRLPGTTRLNHRANAKANGLSVPLKLYQQMITLNQPIV